MEKTVEKLSWCDGERTYESFGEGQFRDSTSIFNTGGLISYVSEDTTERRLTTLPLRVESWDVRDLLEHFGYWDAAVMSITDISLESQRLTPEGIVIDAAVRGDHTLTLKITRPWFSAAPSESELEQQKVWVEVHYRTPEPDSFFDFDAE